MSDQTKPLIVEIFVDHDFEKWFDEPGDFEIIDGCVGQMSLVAIHGNAYFHWNSEANGPGIYRHHNLAIEMGEGCWFIEVRGTDTSTDPQYWNEVKVFFVSFGCANQFEQTSQWIPVTEEVWRNFGETHLKQLRSQDR